MSGEVVSRLYVRRLMFSLVHKPTTHEEGLAVAMFQPKSFMASTSWLKGFMDRYSLSLRMGTTAKAVKYYEKVVIEFLQGRHLRQNQWWPNQQTRKIQEFTKSTIDAFKNGLLPYTFIRGRDGDSLEHFSFGMRVKVKRNPHFNPNSGFTLVAAPDEGISVLAIVFASGSGDVFSCGPQVGHDLAKMQEGRSFGQKVIANPFYNHAKTRSLQNSTGDETFPYGVAPDGTVPKALAPRGSAVAAGWELVMVEGGGGNLMALGEAVVQDPGLGAVWVQAGDNMELEEDEGAIRAMLLSATRVLQRYQVEVSNDPRAFIDGITDEMSAEAVEIRKKTSRLLSSFKMVAHPQFDMVGAAKQKKGPKMGLSGPTNTAGLTLRHAISRDMLQQQMAQLNLYLNHELQHKLAYISEEYSTSACVLCSHLTKQGASKTFRCSNRLCLFTAPRDEKGAMDIMLTFGGSVEYNFKRRQRNA
ncbi:hypothetical protein HDV05_008518, partial [Chytridiales sp. JEL 0842]